MKLTHAVLAALLALPVAVQVLAAPAAPDARSEPQATALAKVEAVQPPQAGATKGAPKKNATTARKKTKAKKSSNPVAKAHAGS